MLRNIEMDATLNYLPIAFLSSAVFFFFKTIVLVNCFQEYNQSGEPFESRSGLVGTELNK